MRKHFLIYKRGNNAMFISLEKINNLIKKFFEIDEDNPSEIVDFVITTIPILIFIGMFIFIKELLKR